MSETVKIPIGTRVRFKEYEAPDLPANILPTIIQAGTLATVRGYEMNSESETESDDEDDWDLLYTWVELDGGGRVGCADGVIEVAE